MGPPGGTQGPPGKGGAAERWRVTPSVGWVTRHGAQPATTRAYKSRPPPGRRTGFAPCKISAPPKAITNSAPKFFCLLFFTESITRRRAVQALHPAKSPPRRQASTPSPQKSFTTFHHRKVPPRRAGALIKPCKRPRRQATTNQARKKEPLPTPERLFLLFWFMPATHLPGGAASRTRHPHPRPSGRRWEKSPASGCASGRTPSPCPYQSQSTAAHPPY